MAPLWPETMKENQVAVIQSEITTGILKKRQWCPFANNLPKKASYLTKLEYFCQEIYNTGDINVARQAIDTLINASNSGCCFLEKYLVIILNFCNMKQHGELLKRIFIVKFDRQQLIENLRRPEYKLNSVDHIIQLLTRVQDLLDYREHMDVAINWLLVILDAYFVEIATNDDAVDIIEKIYTHIDLQCALLREIESSKCLLNSIKEQLDMNVIHQHTSQNETQITNPSNVNAKQIIRKRPLYSIERIKF